MLPVQGTWILSFHSSVHSIYGKMNRDHFRIDLFSVGCQNLYACHRLIMCVQRQGFDSHVLVRMYVCAFFSLPLISWLNSTETIWNSYMFALVFLYYFSHFMFFFFSTLFMLLSICHWFSCVANFEPNRIFSYLTNYNMIVPNTLKMKYTMHFLILIYHSNRKRETER